MEGAVKKRFVDDLLWWFERNPRYLPWKEDNDPYKIWLSEVILQQTTVAQGLPRFAAFIESFPTVHDLAGASQEQVFKLWEGLGYYYRAKNLMAAAKLIVERFNGTLPADYQQLLSLPGVGPYSAAAIASFAYGLPHAVVDGNAIRVLSRVFGIGTPFDTTAGKKVFAQTANSLLPAGRVADFNQAIMNFGALVCKPIKPQCHVCAMRSYCVAFNEGNPKLWPVRAKRPVKTGRFLHYFVLYRNGAVAVNKRHAQDIWQGLHEFILHEDTGILDVNNLKKTRLWQVCVGGNGTVLSATKPMRQVLTHRFVHVVIVEVALDDSREVDFRSVGIQHVQWVDMQALSELAFPVVLQRWIAQKIARKGLFDGL